MSTTNFSRVLFVILGLTVVIAEVNLREPNSRRGAFRALSAVADDCDQIRKQVKDSDTIEVAPGTYVCSSPIVLDRDGIVFKGAGVGKTIFKLADHANAPVIIIGHDTGNDDHPPALVSHIHAYGFSVDGNKDKQEGECWSGPCYSSVKAYLHNNAVTIRAASYVELDHVDLKNNRSGGLVTEDGDDHLNVHDLKSSENYFDGIALYKTTKSLFAKMDLGNNNGAGISIDMNIHDNVLKDSNIHDNHDVAIFARSSWDNTFDNIKMLNNHGDFAVFGAWVQDASTCFSNNTFKNLDVEGNRGGAIKFVGQCDGNRVLNSKIQGNGADTVESDGKDFVLNSGPTMDPACAADPLEIPPLYRDVNNVEARIIHDATHAAPRDST